jgi:micrococcal nuclease
VLKSKVMLSRKSPILALFICASSILTSSFAYADEEFRIIRVIDGDTVVLEDGRHVRYIGMDTPEKERPYYGEAKRENERLVKGKKVRLEYDVEKTDLYGRTLAYVYRGDIFVNAELVKNGHAMIYTFPPNVKYAETFLALQKKAIEQKRGFWGLSPQDIELIKGGHGRSSAAANTARTKNRSFWDYMAYKLGRIFR